jgi:hypothetical protein
MAVLPTPGSPMSTGLFLVRARQHLDDAADLVVAADHRVELALRARASVKVLRVLLQRAVLALGLRARHPGPRRASPSPRRRRRIRSAVAAPSGPERLALRAGRRPPAASRLSSVETYFVLENGRASSSARSSSCRRFPR